MEADSGPSDMTLEAMGPRGFLWYAAGVDAAPYPALAESGELEPRARRAAERLASCDVCPRECRVDRRAGELGTCATGRHARVSSAFPHHGEEDVLRGTRGSGTIFFSGCHLHCVFCQNHDISQGSEGMEVSDHALAGLMVRVQEAGCHNVNLVTPSHVVPSVLAAVGLAARRGLTLPIVWNSSGYDSVESAAILRFLADEVSRDTFVNVMDQYHPAHLVGGRGPDGEPRFPEIARRPTPDEVRRAVRAAREAGLHRFG